MNDSIETETIKLDHPLEHEGQQIAEIKLRRAKVRDIERLDHVKGDVRRLIILFSDLTEHPHGLFRAMDAVDFKKIGKVVEVFLGNAPSPPADSEK